MKYAFTCYEVIRRTNKSAIYVWNTKWFVMKRGGGFLFRNFL